MKDHYLGALLSSHETLFHTQDLAALWQIKKPNTLHTTISRYRKRGLIHRVYKGLYTTGELKEIDPWQLGLKALHQYAYVSCETVLAQAGLINGVPQELTLVSASSRRFTISKNSYRSRKLHDRYLFNDAGIERQADGIKIASVYRALADMFYFNSSFHVDAPYNRKKLNEIWKRVGYPSARAKH